MPVVVPPFSTMLVALMVSEPPPALIEPVLVNVLPMSEKFRTVVGFVLVVTPLVMPFTLS